MSNHTARPWYAANDNEIHDRCANFDRDGARIGDTPNRIAVVEYPYGDIAGQSANARLIAAAPELLAALQSLFDHCAMVHKHWGEGCNQKQADAAIAAGRAAIIKATE